MPMAVRCAPGIGCAFSPIRSTWRTTASICSGLAPASITMSIGFPRVTLDGIAFEGRGVLKAASIIHHIQPLIPGDFDEKAAVDSRRRRSVRNASVRVVLGRAARRLEI